VIESTELLQAAVGGSASTKLLRVDLGEVSTSSALVAQLTARLALVLLRIHEHSVRNMSGVDTGTKLMRIH
jgi:hypothetical protein